VATVKGGRYVVVALTPNKEGLTQKTIDVIKQLQVRLGGIFKKLHSDGGTEFINATMSEFLVEQGTMHTYSTAGTAAHNSISEAAVKTIVNNGFAMMIHSGAPVELWGESTLYAADVRNQTPLKINSWMAPVEYTLGIPAHPKSMRVFGCDVRYYVDKEKRGKFDTKWYPGIFVGLCPRRVQGVRVLDPHTKRITVTRNVKFFENSFDHMAILKRTLRGVPHSAPVPPMASYDSNLYNSQVFGDDNEINIDVSSSHPDVATVLRNGGEIDPLPIMGGSRGVMSDSELESKYDDDQPPLMTTGESWDGITDVETSDDDMSSDSDTEVEPPNAGYAYDSLMDDFYTYTGSYDASAHHAIGTAVNVGTNGVPTEGTVDPALAEAISTSSNATTTRSGRVIQPTSRYGMVNSGMLEPSSRGQYMHVLAETKLGRMYSVLLHRESALEPKTEKQALTGPLAKHWSKSYDDEMQSIALHEVYEWVRRTKDMKVIRMRPVFKAKLGPNNQVERYKTRLVVQGFRQEYGVDYLETFAPVANMASIKMVLAMAAAWDLELYQIDYDTAFLNAELPGDTVVHVQPPERYNTKGPEWVWKLKKALYGLKQAPREWNHTINAYLVSIGYTPNRKDPCVYVKKTTDGRRIILCLYVDDTIIACDKKDESQWLADKKLIADKFKIKDLGEAKWILNMEIKRDRTNRTITLSQQAYIKRKLADLQLDQCRPSVNPLSSNNGKQLIDEQMMLPVVKDGVEHKLFRRLIGELSYAALNTRVDIAFLVAKLSRSLAAPTELHIQAAKHIFRYLAGTADYTLVFDGRLAKGKPMLEAYSDADWANDPIDRRSITGTIVKFLGSPIYWSSKKQGVNTNPDETPDGPALSSTEAEYYAIGAAVADIKWCRQWIREVLGITGTRLGATPVYCDNQSAIYLANSEWSHQRSKHIDVKWHFINESVHGREVVVKWVPTNDQQADILTKALGTNRLKCLRDLILRNDTPTS
jgi:hypothetical protein